LLVYGLRGRHSQREAAAQARVIDEERQAATRVKAALAQAALGMQNSQGLEQLVHTCLLDVHHMFGAFQGVVYGYEQQAQSGQYGLRCMGSFACQVEPLQWVAMGQGLLGQCAVDKRTMVLDGTQNQGQGVVRSGLGQMQPGAVVLVPAISQGVLVGVMELALPAVPEARTLEQIEELGRLLAINLLIAMRHEQRNHEIAATKVAQQALATQLEFQQLTLDALPYPVFFKNAQARFMGFNRAYELAFGVKGEDLLGKRVLDLTYLPEADRLAYQAEDEATIANCGTVEHMMDIPLADGLLHKTRYFVVGIRLADGSPGGLVGSFFDLGLADPAENVQEAAA
jgi:PAS domain-containing protein